MDSVAPVALQQNPFVRQTAGPYTDIPVELYQGTLGTSVATLYTSPAANTVENPLQVKPFTILEDIWICNSDTVPRTFSLYKVPAAGTAGVSNVIMPSCTLQPNESYQVTGRLILGPGVTLQGIASAASVITVTATGTLKYPA